MGRCGDGQVGIVESKAVGCAVGDEQRRDEGLDHRAEVRGRRWVADTQKRGAGCIHCDHGTRVARLDGVAAGDFDQRLVIGRHEPSIDDCMRASRVADGGAANSRVASSDGASAGRRQR